MRETLRQEEFYTQGEDLLGLDSTTSKGAQPKWRLLERDLFIKQDYHGTESISEWTVFNILDQCSNLPKERIVPYYLCKIDSVNGCYSKDFKVMEDEFTLAYIFELQGKDPIRVFGKISSEERLEAIKETLKIHTGKDFDYELKLMFAVDAFFLNEDRHMSNISILEDDTGNFRMSPIFDNGLALLSRLEEYPLHAPLTRHLQKVKPVLINSKFKKHVELFNYPPFLYKDKIEKFIEDNQNILGRVAQILRRQIREPHIQKLFIKPSTVISTSSIFSK